MNRELKREIVRAIGGLRRWKANCHAASLAVVRTGLLPKTARVARGRHPHVLSQHSWVALGDPYDPAVTIVDPTLWGYLNRSPALHVAIANDQMHWPKGAGSIFAYGRPAPPTSEIIALDRDWSPAAREFLARVAPQGLDGRGWNVLANAPVGDWPAREIITAMATDIRLAALVPIDVVGMLTDLNPGGLYW